MILRFIGIEGHYSGRRLERFGQTLDLSDAEAKALVAGNAPLLPAEQFEECGFTAEELERYAYPGPRSNASLEFAAKWRRARIALHELRERLRAGTTLAEGGE